MPKIQAITDEMKAIAGRIGDNVSAMTDSQASIKNCMSNILVHFESTPKVMSSTHLANVAHGYRNSGESLNGYREFLVNAADTYEWNDEQLARWKNTSIGLKIDNTSNTGTAQDNTSPSSVSYQNYDNPKEFIRDFLREKIGNDYGVAALMGNLQAESGFSSNNLQNAYEGSIGMSDEEYTYAVDSGSYDNFIHDSAGYGIAQWTYFSRKQALLEFAKARGTSVGDLQTQLEFLWKELNEGYPGVVNTLKTASSIREASDVFMKQFERPYDQSAAACARRARYGEDLYSELMA